MPMKTFALSAVTSRARFWIVFSFLSMIAAILLFILPNAFFLIDRPVTMDRAGALEAARQASSTYGIGPTQYREALIYKTDDRAKSFIELEGGGVAALNKAISLGVYSPYSWHVRHFNEGKTWEAVLFFSSAGRFVGFRERLPETETNINLKEPDARVLAEGALSGTYGRNLTMYQLVETSSEEKIAGRVDWTFVYENEVRILEEGRVRLSAVVSGNRLTGVNQFLKVPESFERRFMAARSWNAFISNLSLVGMVLLAVAAIWGLVYLLRQQILIWKAPAILGFVLSLLLMLSNLNGLPMQWMNYDTALSTTVFITSLSLVSLLILVGMGVLFTLSIMVAEGLTRKAFPEHIQFWKFFSPAASGPVLKRTGGALLAVPFWLLYVFLFYDITKSFFGWWVPAESLTDPNVIAQYVPWFTPFAGAIQAGVWEELFFRALPIAGAALIGERLKKRNFVIGIAIVVQAVIFAAGHTTYPGLPGYSRLVELFIPAVMFGLIYLRFGILPAILIHFGYNIVLMAQPIFTTPEGAMWIDRTLIVILMLLPLSYALFSKWRFKKIVVHEPLPINGIWVQKPSLQMPAEKKSELPSSGSDEVIASDLEKSPIKSGTEIFKTKSIPAFGGVSSSWIVFAVCAVLGLGVWLFFTDFSVRTGVFRIDRAKAEAVADDVLKLRGISIPTSWKRSTSAITIPGIEDRYVWSEAREEYDRLKGTYLPPNRWRVRYIDFKSKAELRESYEIIVSNSGEVLQLTHSVPESKPGKRLRKDEAEAVAMAALLDQFQINRNETRSVSGKDKNLPKRLDWTFDYSIPNDSFGDIDARIQIRIAGDEVVDAYRYIFVPEDWARSFKSKSSKLSIATSILGLLSLAAIVVGIVQGLITLAKKRFSTPVFLGIGGVLLFGRLAGFFNGWPSAAGNFNPIMPFEIQTAIFAIVGIVTVVVASAAFSIIAGFLWEKSGHGAAISRDSVFTGLGVGAVISGVGALCMTLIPPALPGAASFKGVDGVLPWAETSLGIITGVPSSVIGFALVLLWFRRLQRGSFLLKTLGAGLVFLFAAASINAGTAAPSLGGFFAVSTVAGLFWILFAFTAFSRSSAALPIAVSVGPTLGLIKLVVQNPFPMAVPAAILGIVVTIATVIFLLRFRDVENW